MNQLTSIDHQTLRTGELLVREGLARQQDVDAALNIQLNETDVEHSDLTLSGLDGVELSSAQADNFDKKSVDDIPLRIRTIGEILCEMNLVSPVDLNRVLLKYNKRLKLGEMLKKMGIISEAQIETALESQQLNHKSLGQILVEQEFISEKQLYVALSRQYNIPYKNVDGFIYSASHKAELTQIIGHNYADANSIIPLALAGNKLVLAVFSPESILGVHELKDVYAYLRIECVLIRQDRFCELFKDLYGCKPSLSLETKAEFTAAGDRHHGKLESDSITEPEESAVPSDEDMEAFIHYLLKYGITKNAESIHIEQTGEGASIRYRIGGNLKGLSVPGLDEKLPHLIDELIKKLKEKASLNDLDHPAPQSGLLHSRFLNKDTNRQVEVEYKISILPTTSGDIVTLTARPSHVATPSIDDLQFSIHTRTVLKRLLESSAGIVLISGPLDSGKAHTLSAMIKHLSGPDKKILLAVESVKPEIPGIIQTLVNQNHFTHERLLPALLDHDPDVIVVDTISDRETAQAVAAAANSGPLILCGIDAEDSIDALRKLMALGIERDRIAHCVKGIIAQQRSRRICSSCRKTYIPEPEEWNILFDSFPASLAFHKGAGCSTCGLTGYAGHMILSEVLIIDGKISDAICSQAEQTVIRRVAIESGMKTLVDDGLLKLKQTPLDEIVRVVPFKMIVAHKAAGKTQNTEDHRSQALPSSEFSLDRPIKKEWILSFPQPEESRILEMHENFKRFKHEDPELDPNEKNLFLDFIIETFHQVCRDYKCNHVLFCMECHPKGLQFWAAPISMRSS